MIGTNLRENLEGNPLRYRLIHHPILKALKTISLTHDQAAVIVGQWWHPLHYFPNFLARTIASSPLLNVKTSASNILNEELGEGDPKMAHENLYIQTMISAKFTRECICNSASFEATKRLVQRYEEASANFLSALGFLYGTEVVDLAMVSTIGAAVRRTSGVRELPWVDIHVMQEPNHVVRVQESVESNFDEKSTSEIVAFAEEMWALWIDFFVEIGNRIDVRTDSENIGIAVGA